jgi:mannosyltransferase
MRFLADHTVVKYFTESLWRDEAFSWAMAARGLDALPLTARDFNPPLYYLLLFGWMSIFGTTEVALRSLSVVFFVATLWVVWLFMRDILAIPARRAWLYLSLFALNPVLSYYAVEARMYSMFAFLAAASFYCFLTRRTALYIFSTTAGLYTHYFMSLVVLTQVLYVLLDNAAVARWRRVLLIALPGLLFAPWIAITLLNASGGAAFWIDAPGWRFGAHLITSLYTGHEPTYGFLVRSERWVFALVLIPAVAWALWAALHTAVDRRSAVQLVVFWALLPPALVFICGFFKPMYVPRYLVFSTVGLLLLLTVGLEHARARLRLSTLILLCALGVSYQVIQTHRHSKGEYRETMQAIGRQSGPRDLLYVRNELDFFPAQYYFDPSRVFVFGRSYDQIPTYVGRVLIPAENVLATLPEPSVRIFILQNDREYTSVSPIAVKQTSSGYVVEPQVAAR